MSSEIVPEVGAPEDCLSMISPDDIETIRTLFQQRPDLWDDFKTLTEVVDCLNNHVTDYQKVHGLLKRIYGSTIVNSEKGREAFSHFAAALQFAEKSVEFMRQTMIKKGLTYITQFTLPHPDVESLCLFLLRSIFLNCSCSSKEFATQLAKTGVLQDLMEDLKHMKNQSAERLKKGEAFKPAIGIIINCCRTFDGVAIVRAMNVKDDLKPFLSKDDHDIQALAFCTLSFLVEDDELDLLKVNKLLLQYCFQCIYGAADSKSDGYNGWLMEEVLSLLSRLARNDYNKRLILRTGGLKMLGMVLESRTEVEQANAIKLLTQLAVEAEGKLLMQADTSLLMTVSKLESDENRPFREQAADLLRTIHEINTTPVQQEILTLLKDRVNALAILDTSEVGFVLCQLQVLATGGRHNHKEYSAIQLLEVLSLFVKRDKQKQQMTTQGLDTLCCYLGKGEDAEKRLVLGIVLDIVSDTEALRLVKNHSGFVALLDGLRASENEELSQKANLILCAIDQKI
ncbi:uncharacterized protein LOC112567337 isoform X1 [Pomacea canaliculata]|uniref:uncharacterized protein LOC112567337 isoform X1 n=2 Tax=Pomacea canaliculata TaxID=400727 RepID=UPI000D72A29D|nr:uncharacterized protein LOC112567337 isoform X1 [Pomacea canaliculata]XP_025099781.1 uncharacterized protein LOC112567337 isoform X1 [Pomacea canaliculata]XP_025099782.1 uncharacterized protein LOC112567337 isoform X1 [Pomacea canaliculata]XP_025099783.1 uncharacterized protein LOC112567337 isoform X1 [Pomacea canaliculata]